MTRLRGAVPESPAGSLAIDADRAAGVIYVESKGIWNEQIVRRHFADLETLLVEWRTRFGGARVLVDLRAAGEQSPAVDTLLRSLIMAVYVETDRVATLVSVDLRRVSVVQRVYGFNRKLFDDPIAALRWLRTG